MMSLCESKSLVLVKTPVTLDQRPHTLRYSSELNYLFKDHIFKYV